MEKKDIDWSNLSFGYQETDYSFVSNYKDGKWQHYSINCETFKEFKAYITSIVCCEEKESCCLK